MKYFRPILGLTICLLAYLWANQIYAYFYGITIADQLGLILIIALCVFFLTKIKHRIPTNPWIVTGTGFLSPFLVYPIISELIHTSDYSWVVVPAFLVMASAAIVLQERIIQYGIVLAGFLGVFLVPYDFVEIQMRFYDRLEGVIETRQGSAQLVSWKNDSWLYYNGQLQYATLDKKMFQEAYVRPIMQFSEEGERVLLVGGDNGMVEDELSRIGRSVDLTILPMDKEFHRWVRDEHRTSIVHYTRKKVHFDEDFFHYLDSNQRAYDIIIVDLPDPVNLDYLQYYTLEFYALCNNALKEDGFLVTQTGDLFKNSQKVFDAWETVRQSGFEILPYQCQVPTVGHWTWVVGSKSQNATAMKTVLSSIEAQDTEWWNQEAMHYMMSFGKQTYFSTTPPVVVRLNE